MKTKSQFQKLFFVVWTATLSLSFTSCSNDDEGSEPEDRSGVVEISNHPSHGNVLVDGNGVSLYFFTPDVAGNSTCTGGCLNFWPVYHSEELEVGAGLNADDFSTITTSNGDEQTTYKGWPLYYYAPAGDGVTEDAGAVAGDGVNDVWYIAKPDYSLMQADAQLVGNDGKNYKSDYTEGEEVTTYFTDARGRTLYIFVNDGEDANNFTNGDEAHDANWPIFHVAIESLPSSMDASEFGEIEVLGEKQLTFRGWPLYYFGQDTGRGDNKGVSVPVPGVWPVVNNELAEAQ